MATKNWKDMKARLGAEPGHAERLAAARARAAAAERAYVERLGDLRKARGATQVALAERARLSQSGVARIERQADLYVSTLRRYIEALGGELEVRAVFPDQDVEIRFDDFASIDHDNPDLTEAEPGAVEPPVAAHQAL